MKIDLTPEQWVGLLMSSGRYLPSCCPSISVARDVLYDVLRENGNINVGDARRLVAEVENHDVIVVAFLGGADPSSPSWATEPGSPWPKIAEACKALGCVPKPNRRPSVSPSRTPRDLADGDRVRELREFLGMRQNDLAERSGLDRSTIAKIETGRQRASRVKVSTNLAIGFGLNHHDFVSYMNRTLNMEDAAVRVGCQEREETEK